MTPRRVTEAVAKAGINEQTVSYELVLTDEGKIIEMNVGAANTLTIPANADVAFEVGTVIMIVQIGTGQGKRHSGWWRGHQVIRIENQDLRPVFLADALQACGKPMGADGDLA